MSHEKEQYEQLLKQIAFCNVEAFEILYKDFVPRLYRYLRVKLYREDDIHDVMQETFVTIWKSASQFQGNGSPLTWMFGIARHKLLDCIRKSHRQSTRELSCSDEDLMNAAWVNPIKQIDSNLTLLTVFERLPENLKELAYLVFVEELPYKDIYKHVPHVVKSLEL